MEYSMQDIGLFKLLSSDIVKHIDINNCSELKNFIKELCINNCDEALDILFSKKTKSSIIKMLFENNSSLSQKNKEKLEKYAESMSFSFS